jgi:hypothetical protein
MKTLTHLFAFLCGVALTLTATLGHWNDATHLVPPVQTIAPPVQYITESLSSVPPSSESSSTDVSVLEAAIWMVESGGQEGWIVGDGGAALGPLQIHRGCWTDALEHDPSIGGKYEDCENIEYSLKVFRAYMARYCVPHRIGDMPYDEAAARIWNGGPRGHRKNATVGYWFKVENHRDDPHLFDIMP